MSKRVNHNSKIVASTKTRMTDIIGTANGRIGVPILLYFLGVPGIIVLLLWAVFFRD